MGNEISNQIARIAIIEKEGVCTVAPLEIMVTEGDKIDFFNLTQMTSTISFADTAAIGTTEFTLGPGKNNRFEAKTVGSFEYNCAGAKSAAPMEKAAKPIIIVYPRSV